MTQSSDKKIKLSPEVLQKVSEKLEGADSSREPEPEVEFESHDAQDGDTLRGAAKKFAEAISDQVNKKIGINLRLHPNLHRELREICRGEDRSIQSLLQEGVRLVLMARKLRGIAFYEQTTPEAMISDYIAGAIHARPTPQPRVPRKKGS